MSQPFNVANENPTSGLTFVSEKREIYVGTDFVDAVRGNYISRGRLTLRNPDYPTGAVYNWQSTVDAATTEAALRTMASREGRTILEFTTN